MVKPPIFAICLALLLIATDARAEQEAPHVPPAGDAGYAVELAQTSSRLTPAPAGRDPWAGEAEAPDKIWLFDPRDEARSTLRAFRPRYTGPVAFDHKGHVIDARLRCNSCHHDYRAHRMERIPRCELCHRPDTGARVQPRLKCVVCHASPGLFGERGPGAVIQWDGGIKPELLMLGDSFHRSCGGCHREANRRAGLVTNPVSCRTCHTPTQTEYVFDGE